MLLNVWLVYLRGQLSSGALSAQRGARPGETPLPSLVSLLAACVHRPGLVVTCSGRVWCGWVQTWVGALLFPGRLLRFGYPYFAPRGAYRRFSAVPVVWRVQEDCGAVRPPRTAPGLFPRPVRSVPLVRPRRSFLGPSLDGPVLLPEARRGVLPPSRWIGASGRLWGRQVCTEGRGVRFPGAFPCRWRFPVSLPGWACFAPRGAYRRFAALPVDWRVQEDGGAVRPAQRLPPRGAGGRFPLLSPPFFCAPYIKGKKINRSV